MTTNVYMCNPDVCNLITSKQFFPQHLNPIRGVTATYSYPEKFARVVQSRLRSHSLGLIYTAVLIQ